MLYRIPYHTAVVRNADNPATTVPYRTTNSLPIIKGRNSNNLDIGIPAWYGTEPLPRICRVPYHDAVVRNHSKELCPLPYHGAVVCNASKPVQKLPYHGAMVRNANSPIKKIPYHTTAATVTCSCK